MTKLVNLHRRKAAIFLLFLFIIVCFISRHQEAKAIAIVDDILYAAIIGTLLAAAGIKCASVIDLDSVYDKFMNEEAALGANIIAGGKIVYEAGKDAYKYVADIAETDWLLFQAWVNDNYQVGEQGSTGNQVIISSSTIADSEAEFNYGPVYLIYKPTQAVSLAYRYDSETHLIWNEYQALTPAVS